MFRRRVYPCQIANARRFWKVPITMTLLQSRDLEILGHPFLRHLSLGLAGLRYRVARLELTLDNQRAESVVEQIALGFQ